MLPRALISGTETALSTPMANPQLIAEGRLRPEGYHRANDRSFLHAPGAAKRKRPPGEAAARPDRSQPLLSVVAHTVDERVVA
jgi:hypothetical protein